MKLILLNRINILLTISLLLLSKTYLSLKLENILNNSLDNIRDTITTQTNLVLNSQRVFDKLIKKYEHSINSVRLGNYLRKMLLENNNVIDDEMIFINQEDIDEVTKDDLNYDLQLDENSLDELRARLFAKLWVKHSNKNGVPYSVNEEVKLEHMTENWKVYLVLLTNSGSGSDENALMRVCFPVEAEENFAIVVDSEKSCKSKINKIDSFRILNTSMESKEAKEKEAKFKELMGEDVVPETKLQKLERKELKRLERKNSGKPKHNKKHKKAKKQKKMRQQKKAAKEHVINVEMKADQDVEKEIEALKSSYGIKDSEKDNNSDLSYKFKPDSE